MNWLWTLLARLFGSKTKIAKLPDDQEIPDAEADDIVGNVDDTLPVELEEGDPSEVADPNEDPEFDAAHEEGEDAEDPEVVITDDPEDGSVYSDTDKPGV